MAIKKKIKTKHGVDAELWRIESLRVDYQRKNAMVILVGYFNQLAVDDKLQPLEARPYSFRGPSFPLTGLEPENVREKIYNAIKQLPEFDGSIDC